MTVIFDVNILSLKRMLKEKGFAHSLIIITLVLMLGAALSVVFINKLMKQEQTTKLSKIEATSDKPTVQKTYTSISGSGLTFDYPSNWYFEEPTKQQFSRDNMRGTIMMLTSQKISVVDGVSATPVSNICITFLEMQGNWTFESKPISFSDKVEDFVVGQNQVSLVESKSGLRSIGGPDMQIINQDSSSRHGGAYIALNNEYFLLATAANDCFSSDTTKKKDLITEIKEAREIMKSVRIIE